MFGVAPFLVLSWRRTRTVVAGPCRPKSRLSSPDIGCDVDGTGKDPTVLEPHVAALPTARESVDGVMIEESLLSRWHLDTGFPAYPTLGSSRVGPHG
jgi:hypothetical protein